jgi:sodium/proline symporter
MAGGIRASIWTDAAQSVVMLVSMAILLGACTLQVGGLSSLYEALQSVDPALVSIVPQGLAWGFGLYLMGFVFAGVGTIGQPHILVRFMAIDETKSLAKARNIYFTWYTVFSVACILVGLYARVLMPDLGAGLSGAALETAAEAALPELSILMLTPVLIGVMLAGLFSATMSTADSQILSCSAAVTQDVFPRWSNSLTAAKVATISVALLALFIALFASSGVFWLVMLAWAALAAAVGPLLLVRLSGLPLSSNMGVVMMASGLVTTVAWGFFPFASNVYRAMPGMLVPMVIYGVAYLIANKAKTA